MLTPLFLMALALTTALASNLAPFKSELHLFLIAVAGLLAVAAQISAWRYMLGDVPRQRRGRRARR